jgi:hypothetical protein
MNKKRGALIFVILLVSLGGFSFVSAGFWDGLLGLTGNVVDTDSDLILYYPFDGNLADTTLNYPGVTFGNVSFGEGKFGDALVLDSKDVSSYLKIENFMKNPSDLILKDAGMFWELLENSFYSYSSLGEGPVNGTYASFSFNERSGSSYAYVNMQFSSEEDLSKRLDSLVNSDLCKKEEFVFGGGSEWVYVCKGLWNEMQENKDLSRTYGESNDVRVLWYEGAKLFTVYLSQYNYDYCDDYESCLQADLYRTQRQQEMIADVFEKLMDNQGSYVSGLYVGYPGRVLIETLLQVCPSEILPDQNYVGAWSCKTEPILCPPHGEQKVTCTRWNENIGEQEVREENMHCSPGICAGCVIPRWFQGGEENVCIPYGIRFAEPVSLGVGIKTDEDYEIFYEKDSQEGEVELQVLSDDVANLTLYSKEGVPYSYKLIEGTKTDIDLPDFFDEEKIISFVIDSQEINYVSSGSEENYVDMRIILQYEGDTFEEVNSYCDYDGRIKVQKTFDKEGMWASCQNNYECESNVCSSGQCIEVTSMLEESNRIKGLFFSLFCKLVNPFNSDDYNSCVADFLG